MKPEEAIEILELPKDPLQSGTHYHAIPSLKRITYSEYLDARATAIAALEKQIPKKPDAEGDGYGDNGEIIDDTWICHNCESDYEMDYEKYDYCPKCGQRIDWSEEDET